MSLTSSSSPFAGLLGAMPVRLTGSADGHRAVTHSSPRISGDGDSMILAFQDECPYPTCRDIVGRPFPRRPEGPGATRGSGRGLPRESPGPGQGAMGVFPPRRPEEIASMFSQTDWEK